MRFFLKASIPVASLLCGFFMGQVDQLIDQSPVNIFETTKWLLNSNRCATSAAFAVIGYFAPPEERRNIGNSLISVSTFLIGWHIGKNTPSIFSNVPLVVTAPGLG